MGSRSRRLLKPVDPFQRRELDGLEFGAWPSGFGEGIVIEFRTLPTRKARRQSFSQAIGVLKADVLSLLS